MWNNLLIKSHFPRLKEIARILSKYELEDLAERLNLPPVVTGHRKVRHLPIGRKITAILQELGPTYIKLGQALSSHPEVIPASVITELEKLQDKVDPFPFRDVVRIIETSLGSPIADIFESFEETPIASASIAQVHEARLKTGEKVAVKVQRPDLEVRITQDLELLHAFAILLQRSIPELKRYELPRMVTEFERSIGKEIDFRLEAENFDRFRRNFSGDADVYFPRVHTQFSGKHVLTLEFIEGARISAVIRDDSGHDRRRIAERGVSAVYKQIFRDGFFHADPHAGNIIVMKDDVVCFVDAGMVGFLAPETQTFLTNLLIGVSSKNVRGLVSMLVNEGMVPDDCPMDRLRDDLEDLFNRYYDTGLDRIDLSDLLNRFVGLLYTYRIKLPSNLLLLMRCLTILVGVGRQIDPKFNPTASMLPYASDMMRRQYEPARVISDVRQFFQENLWMIRSFPGDILLLLQKITQGKFEVRLDHQGLEDVTYTINRTGSRLTGGIIIAGTIVASSLIARSDMPPHIAGFSVFGVLGYLVSLVMVIHLYLTIRKDLR